MALKSIKFRGHNCFKTEWTGFDPVRPINLIIGRNNTGKSRLLDLAQVLCTGKLTGNGWQYQCLTELDEKLLRSTFQENTSGGALNGNHWGDHGRHFVNAAVSWEFDEHQTPKNISLDSPERLESPWGPESANMRLQMITSILPKDVAHPLKGTSFRHLLADRDIRPEVASTNLELASDGIGATNIIRRHIVTSNSAFPREIIQIQLLGALNKIFAGDGKFTEIQVKVHDDSSESGEKWEIFLGEEKKGLISLSNSGSGLKTVILVLLNLLVIPRINGNSASNFTFAFEELENNLHPSLLRRLLQYIEAYAVAENCVVFLTTHSSVALDLFGLSKHAQIIHVRHDGEAASANMVAAHFEHIGVISELGARPSDLLQANGVIWVEGPSDCVYLNRWLHLHSDGQFREGRDYLCAFYGGALLARAQFSSPEEAENELVNLLRVNSNIVVVCDGDRAKQGSPLKDRVKRIRSEVEKIPGAHVWVTRGREIENYLTGSSLQSALGLTNLPDPTQHEAFFPRKRDQGGSYLESRLNRKGIDKMELAMVTTPYLDKVGMSTRFDWEAQMKIIVRRIEEWNS